MQSLQCVKDLKPDELSSHATKEVDQQLVINGGDIERFCKAVDMKALAFWLLNTYRKHSVDCVMNAWPKKNAIFSFRYSGTNTVVIFL